MFDIYMIASEKPISIKWNNRYSYGALLGLYFLLPTKASELK